MSVRARTFGGRPWSVALMLSVATTWVAACGDSESRSNGSGGRSGAGGTSSGGSAGRGGSGGESGDDGSGGKAGSTASGGKAGSAAAGSAGRGSGAQGGTAGGGGSGASAGKGGGGTGGEVDRTETSMPDADLEGSGGTIVDNDGETVDDDGSGWVQVLASHYYAEASVQELVERWLVLVENGGGYRVCNVKVDATFLDDDGMKLGEASATVASKTYALPSGDGPVFCLEAGERALGAGFVYRSEPLDPSAVAEVRYEIFGVAIPDVERKDWVTLEDEELDDQADGKVVRGTLRNGDATLGWWQVRVFALGTDGVPLRAQDLSPGSNAVEPDETWDFESAPFTSPEIRNYHNVVDHGPPT